MREQKKLTEELEDVSEGLPSAVIEEIEKEIRLWDLDPMNNPDPFRFGKSGT